MKYSLNQLRQVKGIGKKTIERIKEQFDESEYISKYNPEIHIDPDTLVLGDMLEEMNGIPDKSIDMILTDLPYGTTASDWDSIINSKEMWSQYERVISDRGAIALFSSGRFTNKLINSNPGLYRYKWIWEKSRTGNFVNANNRPPTKYEEICIFSKGITANTDNIDMKMIYNPQGLVEINKTIKTGDSKFGTMHGKRPSHKSEYVAKYTNYPVDVLKFDSVGITKHPTQKPVDLLEYLIKTYTNENGVVLDSTMGSGSTGVACKNTNRKFIGIELDEEYYNIAKERIESENSK